MIEVILSISPSLLFLFCLQVLDSYKLVRLKTVVVLLFLGSLTAIISYIVNVNLIELLGMNTRNYSRFMAPVVEELLKTSFIIFFLLSKRIGFIVDGAIFGFSIGAGFAILENIYYLNNIGEANLFIWFLRGFGTSIMHGCTTAIYSILIKYYSDRNPKRINYFIPLFLIVPFIIHGFFNSFILTPIAFTVMQLTITPILFYIAFMSSERQMKNWLELSLESNHELLAAINQGHLLDTKAGIYLNALKEKFSPLVLVDLLCYIRLYIELSMLAKGLLIMKEIGFTSSVVEEVESKLDEMKYLESKIGFTGKLAIQPVVYNEKGISWIRDLLSESTVK